jgi:hypothetical protein
MSSPAPINTMHSIMFAPHWIHNVSTLLLLIYYWFKRRPRDLKHWQSVFVKCHEGLMVTDWSLMYSIQSAPRKFWFVAVIHCRWRSHERKDVMWMDASMNVTSMWEGSFHGPKGFTMLISRPVFKKFIVSNLTKGKNLFYLCPHLLFSEAFGKNILKNIFERPGSRKQWWLYALLFYYSLE